MSVISNNQLAGASGQGGGSSTSSYSIDRSLRFNSSDSAYLNRTPSSAGNRRTWTWSGWVKRSASARQSIFVASTQSPNNQSYIDFSADNISVANVDSGSLTSLLTSSAVYRDYSAWYHIVLAVDTTAATSTDRIKLYVNGTQVTQFSSATYPAQNYDTHVNNTIVHSKGLNSPFVVYPFDGYLADVHFIDGTQLAASDFGEFDTNGIWQPKAYTGTYGTNGFHLDFSDNSTAAALGTDTSGNGNDWTVNNISNTVAGKTYALSGHTASNGVAPNGGTPYWVDIVPSNANLNYWSLANLNYGFYEIHDSSLTEYLYWTGSSYSQGNVTQARFDLRDYPTVSSVRIYAKHINGNTTTYPAYVARLLDSNKNVINNTSVSITSSTAQWLTIPVTGSPAFVEIYAPTPANARVYFYSIEVNGTVPINVVASEANSDSLLDSPTNGTQTDTGAGGEVVGNYATWNPLTKTSAHTLSNGNLDVTTTAAGNLVASIFLSSGKWYWEVNSDGYVGITGANGIGYIYSMSAGGSDSYGYWSSGYLYSGAGSYISGGASFSYSDTIGVALDIDGNNVKFFKNGVQQYSIALNYSNWEDLRSGVFPSINGGGNGTRNFTLNAGQRPFAYTAPSGYKALCTANLPTPTIEKGSDYFDTTLYTGNGSTQTISGLDFSPDLVWIKRRNGIKSHRLQDVIRGTYYLESDTTAAEVDAGAAGLTTFNSDGFTLGGGSAYNALNATYAAWTWDAGTSTVTNTDGSITSTVRANPSAGFSVIGWTGGSSGTVSIGHGLGVAPSFIIMRPRNSTSNWACYHKSLGNDAFLRLNTADTSVSSSACFGTGPTSTVFTINQGNLFNISGDYIAYAFSPVDGYSSFGSYTGNGSADGPFVYTGLRPRWLLIRSTAAKNWHIIDTTRNPYNVVGNFLNPNDSSAEVNYSGFDMLSNGFKLRNIGNTVNSNSLAYLYVAFAENPFALNARAR